MPNIIQTITYDAIEVGQKATIERNVEEKDILLFAAASGDNNPVHLNAEYAATTNFKKPIAHGMLSAGFISAAMACHLPGPGSVYLTQTLEFLRPVHAGDTLRIEIEVLEKLPKNQVRLSTKVFNQRNKRIVVGDATALLPNESVAIEMAELPKVAIG
ncbi:MaoC family dehydratase [Entomomonas asaccharolytica]|uniref:MaoC family dehydratase n=1 Tax=Entomomonas asaccharolytica TaxID=2785331 RepID=A0A974RXZ3_9GAMM|nr:MaoC family dehydratase [Entomomonas asaccharolytica]QQP86720.1 MaoC family dehydratase [Entomomonas asaccharolytica]